MQDGYFPWDLGIIDTVAGSVHWREVVPPRRARALLLAGIEARLHLVTSPDGRRYVAIRDGWADLLPLATLGRARRCWWGDGYGSPPLRRLAGPLRLTLTAGWRDRARRWTP